MNNDKDQRLEALFAEAATEVPDERFTVGVMGRVDRMRYRVMLAWLAGDAHIIQGYIDGLDMYKIAATFVFCYFLFSR